MGLNIYNFHLGCPARALCLSTVTGVASVTASKMLLQNTEPLDAWVNCESNPRYQPFVFLTSTPSQAPPSPSLCLCLRIKEGTRWQLLDISLWELSLKGKLHKGWACFNRSPNQMIDLSCLWSNGRADEEYKTLGGNSNGLGMPSLYTLKALNKCPQILPSEYFWRWIVELFIVIFIVYHCQLFF